MSNDTAPLTAQTFHGTDDETYYCDASLRLWCVQSPDLAATRGQPVRVTSLPEGAQELADESCSDLDVDTDALDASE